MLDKKHSTWHKLP